VFLVSLSVDEMALQDEVVVDVGMERCDSGKRAYLMTTRRITSGSELKSRNGFCG